MSYTLMPAQTSRFTTSFARQSLAVDTRALDALRLQAARSASAPQGNNGTHTAIKEVAREFESLFMHELIKSMRKASVDSGLVNGSEGHWARDLFDQQLAVQMSGQPGGLAQAVQRQLAQQLHASDTAAATATHHRASTTTMATPNLVAAHNSARIVSSRQPDVSTAQAPAPKTSSREHFVQHHRAAAARVARESAIPANFMLGQAGHETGWGKHEIRHSDGSRSFNLFGIKAGKDWTGKVAVVTTTEYIGGTPRKVKARFRAYDSYEASFRDYARLIAHSPRYQHARTQTHSPHAWAMALQKAGYATDPQYAAKLSRAIHRVQGEVQVAAASATTRIST